MRHRDQTRTQRRSARCSTECATARGGTSRALKVPVIHNGHATMAQAGGPPFCQRRHRNCHPTSRIFVVSQDRASQPAASATTNSRRDDGHAAACQALPGHRQPRFMPAASRATLRGGGSSSAGGWRQHWGRRRTALASPAASCCPCLCAGSPSSTRTCFGVRCHLAAGRAVC